MNLFDTSSSLALQPFEPHPDALYSLETLVHLTRIDRHTILVYCRAGLVAPVTDPDQAGYYFNDEAVRILRCIEHLREERGINLAGTKLILELMAEIEQLRAEVRFLRGH